MKNTCDGRVSIIECDLNAKLEKVFEDANRAFLANNSMLFDMEIAERTLCGALMIELHERIKNTEFSDYYVDVEYNRNKGKVKAIKKTYEGPKGLIVTINCDLIVHSRGQKIEHDNLIAIEMKKSQANSVQKKLDKERLECLTRNPECDELTWEDGRKLPEHVCGYALGIYYEVNFRRREIQIEYYREGELYKNYIIKI